MADILGTSSVLGVPTADAWITNTNNRRHPHKEKIYMLTASLAEMPDPRKARSNLTTPATALTMTPPPRAASAGVAAAARIASSSPASNTKPMTTLAYKKSLALAPLDTKTAMWLGPRRYQPGMSSVACNPTASLAKSRSGKRRRAKNPADSEVEKLCNALDGVMTPEGTMSIRWDRTPVTEHHSSPTPGPGRLGSLVLSHASDDDILQSGDVTLVTHSPELDKGEPFIQWMPLATPNLMRVPIGVGDVMARARALSSGRAAFEAHCKSAAHRIVTEYISGTSRPSIPQVHNTNRFALYTYKKTRFLLQKGDDNGGLQREMDILSDIHALDLHATVAVPFACKVRDRGFTVWCCAVTPRCTTIVKFHEYLGVLKIKIGLGGGGQNKVTHEHMFHRGPIRSAKKGYVEGLPEDDECTPLTELLAAAGQGVKEVTPLAVFLESAEVGVDEDGHGYLRGADVGQFPTTWREAVETAKTFNSGLGSSGVRRSVQPSSKSNTPRGGSGAAAASTGNGSGGVSPRGAQANPVDALINTARRPTRIPEPTKLIPQNPIRDTNTTTELRSQQQEREYPPETQLAWEMLVAHDAARQARRASRNSGGVAAAAVAAAQSPDPLTPSDVGALAEQFGFTTAVLADVLWLLENVEHVAPKPMLSTWLEQDVDAVKAVVRTEMACQGFCDTLAGWMRDVCPKGVVSEKALVHYALLALVRPKARLHTRVWGDLGDACIRLYGAGVWDGETSAGDVLKQYLVQRSSHIFGVQLPHRMRGLTPQALGAIVDLKPNDLELYAIMTASWAQHEVCQQTVYADVPLRTLSSILRGFNVPETAAAADAAGEKSSSPPPLATTPPQGSFNIPHNESFGGAGGSGGGGVSPKLAAPTASVREVRSTLLGMTSEVKAAAAQQLAAMDGVMSGTSLAVLSYAGTLLALMTDTNTAQDRQMTTMAVLEDLWRRVLHVHQIRMIDENRKRVVVNAMSNTRGGRGRKVSNMSVARSPLHKTTPRGDVSLPDAALPLRPGRGGANKPSAAGGSGPFTSPPGSAQGTRPKLAVETSATGEVGGLSESLALLKADGQAATPTTPARMDPPARVFLRALKIIVYIPQTGGDVGYLGMIEALTSLANWYNSVEQYVKARDVTEQIAVIRNVRTASGGETLKNHRLHLEFLMQQREYGEAMDLFVHMLAMADLEHGAGHSITLELMRRFTQYLIAMKQHDDAAKWLHTLARRFHAAGQLKNTEATMVLAERCARKSHRHTEHVCLTMLHQLTRVTFLCKNYKRVVELCNKLLGLLASAQRVFPLPYCDGTAFSSQERMQDDVETLLTVVLARLAGAPHNTTSYTCEDPFDDDPFAHIAGDASTAPPSRAPSLHASMT